MPINDNLQARIAHAVADASVPAAPASGLLRATTDEAAMLIALRDPGLKASDPALRKRLRSEVFDAIRARVGLTRYVPITVEVDEVDSADYLVLKHQHTGAPLTLAANDPARDLDEDEDDADGYEDDEDDEDDHPAPAAPSHPDAGRAVNAFIAFLQALGVAR